MECHQKECRNQRKRKAHKITGNKASKQANHTSSHLSQTASMVKLSFLHVFLVAALHDVGIAYALRDNKGRRRLSKSSKGKGYSSTDGDYPLTLLQEVVEPSGSNDSTHLEHICDLFAEFESVASSNTVMDACETLEGFKFLMCPDEYETMKICASSGPLDINDAIMNAYCLPMFESLNDIPAEGMLCADLCSSFFVEADCCNLSCP